MNANKRLVAVILVAAIALTSFAGEKPALDPDKQTKALARTNNKFAFDLYAKLSIAKGNLFLSPYSISTALAMTGAGAENKTVAQMADVLGFPPEQTKKQLAATFGKLQKALAADPNEKACELSIANALWAQKGFNLLDTFTNLVRTEYDAGLEELDFRTAPESARKTINAWVEKNTKNKIKDLIKPGILNSMTRLVLTNAIYFKGNWAEQFKESATHPAPFTLADGKKIEVPMMNRTDRFRYVGAGNLQVLELPYAGGELSMTIFLPTEGRTLADFEKKLTAKRLESWFSSLRTQEVRVSIPKFEITSEFSIAKVLKSMGMTDAFDFARADFSGINGQKNLCISDVIHKAFVEVNEKGTEAAAATAVTIRLTSIPTHRPPTFKANRPFLFLIRQNKTGSILFIGRVANPKK